MTFVETKDAKRDPDSRRWGDERGAKGGGEVKKDTDSHRLCQARVARVEYADGVRSAGGWGEGAGRIGLKGWKAEMSGIENKWFTRQVTDVTLAENRRGGKGSEVERLVLGRFIQQHFKERLFKAFK